MEGITKDEYGNISFVRPDATRLYQMVAQKHALALEIKTGIRFSSKGNLCAHLKRQYGFTGNKKQVLAQLQALIEEVTGG